MVYSRRQVSVKIWLYGIPRINRYMWVIRYTPDQQVYVGYTVYPGSTGICGNIYIRFTSDKTFRKAKTYKNIFWKVKNKTRTEHLCLCMINFNCVRLIYNAHYILFGDFHSWYRAFLLSVFYIFFSRSLYE